jgi:hypothetical protein
MKEKRRGKKEKLTNNKLPTSTNTHHTTRKRM